MSVKAFIGVFLLGAVAAFATVAVNAGIGLPDNGPCTPKLGQVGFCNDSGIPTVYDDSGDMYHLPVPGPQGNPGSNGTNGLPGIQGIQGIQGVPGTPMPNPVKFVCNPGKGTIANGASMVCTWSVQ